MVERRNEKPLIFGYCSAPPGIRTEQSMQERARLTAFAEREGYALAEVFTEVSAEPSVAMQAMLDSAARRQVAAVVVPGMRDLGSDGRVQRATRDRLAKAGILVLILVGGAV